MQIDQGFILFLIVIFTLTLSGVVVYYISLNASFKSKEEGQRKEEKNENEVEIVLFKKDADGFKKLEIKTDLTGAILLTIIVGGTILFKNVLKEPDNSGQEGLR